MSDIFISYSSHDREQADLLTELLASAGLSVWIDQAGIGAATSWSGEISKAITDCKALIVLLSPSSVDSKNVTREVALAFERNKKILPIDLEPVTLPDDFAYHLAGIQRAPMTNIDSIIRALGKLGLEATGAPKPPKIIKEGDTRKSLMILPFQDLSPTGDNGWFADGIVSEMIQALSNVKALLVTDAQSTKDFKRYQGTLLTYAKEMGIRYFVEGDVRKFGDQIKINSRLLDIETGDHLWQDSMKGTMSDIFEIQEAVALKVVEGLKVHLASDEKKKLAERGTENAEAYELFLKANEYFQRQSKEGFQLAAQLWSEAIHLDPAYANAYSFKANALAGLYRAYTRDPALLEEGLSLVNEARRLKPDLWAAYHPLSFILQLQGKDAEAEEAAQEYIRNAPDESGGHFALGFFYTETGQHAKAIEPYEESLKRKSEFYTLYNLVISCFAAKEEEKQRHWADIAIPLHEKRIKLFPEDENTRVNHANLLHFAGRDGDARTATRNLNDIRDGGAIFSTAWLQCELKEYSAGIQTFSKALQAGYRNMRDIKGFLDDENGGLSTLKGTPEYETVRELVEKLEAENERT